MGRGNTCVSGEYEGLYYVDWDNFSKEYETSDGEVVESYDFQRSEWENSLEEFIFDFTKKYKSFSTCEEFIGRSETAVLENRLFYIVIEDNEWSMVIKLVQKEQGYYSNGNMNNLQSRLYKIYLEGMKECLFNQFEELGIYGGAWTHGTIKRTA